MFKKYLPEFGAFSGEYKQLRDMLKLANEKM
jgi:hypothetical protein